MCDSSRCLECADALLLSVRRSGRRRVDPMPPFDDILRQVSRSLPFGTQHPQAFEEAEPFRVVVPPGGVPLRDRAVACEQSTQSDDTWLCAHVMISHAVCGHEGTLQFSAPTYEVREQDTHLRVTVVRSGGGVGEVAVEYALRYDGSATSADASATAHYTASRTLRFLPGHVALTFRVTIHDDLLQEGSETFSLVLLSAAGGATLGPQRRAVVTILDDDMAQGSVHVRAARISGAGASHATAGEPASLTLDLVDIHGAATLAAPHLLHVELVPAPHPFLALPVPQHGLPERHAPLATATLQGLTGSRAALGSRATVGATAVVHGFGNGTFLASYVPAVAGEFALRAQLLQRGGLRGQYFDNAGGWGLPTVSRIDAVLNFTWGTGPIGGEGTDFVSVRWTGRVRPPTTGHYELHLAADEKARLWLDDELVLDTWHASSVAHALAGPAVGADAHNDSAVVPLVADRFHALRVEFRDTTGPARVALMWRAVADATATLQVIPPAALWSEHDLGNAPAQVVQVAPAAPSAARSQASGDCLTGVAAGTTCHVFAHSLDRFGNSRCAGTARDEFLVRASLVAGGSGGDGPLSEVEGEYLGVAPETTAVRAEARPCPGAHCPPCWSHAFQLHLPASGVYRVRVLLVTDATVLDAYGNPSVADVAGSPFTVQVLPGRASAARSQVSGAGLATGVAGVPAFAALIARDQHGNLVGGGGAPFLLRAYHTADPAVVVAGTVVDAGDGTYAISWVPERAGAYSVAVTLRGLHLPGSPFAAQVTHAAPAASRTVAQGPGTLHAVSGVSAPVTVLVRDRFGNPHTAPLPAPGLSRLGAQLSGTPVAVAGAAQHVGADAHLLHVVPSTAGAQLLRVTLDGEDVADSPFLVTVSDGASNSARSVAWGEGLTRAVTGQPARLHVQAADASGNNRTSGGDAVTAVVRLTAAAPGVSAEAAAAAGVPAAASVTNHGNGTYTAAYVYLVAGQYQLTLSLNGAAISGSPFAVAVAPGATSTQTSTASGAALTGGVTGAALPLTVTAHDAYGNPRAVGGDWLYVTVTPPDTLLGLPTPVHPNPSGAVMPRVRLLDAANTGVYSTAVVITEPGPADVHVQLAQPGGLHATYFASADLLLPVLTRVEASVDAAWGWQAPAAGLRAQHFSVRWHGWVRAPQGAALVLWRVAGPSATRLLLDGAPVGSNWPTQAGDTPAQAVVQGWHAMRANSLHSFVLEASFTHAPTSMQLTWSTDGQTFQPVPAVSLHRMVTVAASPYRISVAPSSAVSARCNATGAGLARAVAAVEAGFVVVVRDAFGNARWQGGDAVVAVAVGTSAATQGEAVFGAVLAASDGSYLVRYTPSRAGEYALSVLVNAPAMSPALGAAEVLRAGVGHHIQGSPFSLVVGEGTLDASRSIVWGGGMREAVAGEPATVWVQAVDGSGNNRTEGGGQLTATLLLASSSFAPAAVGAQVEGVAEPAGAGLYRVTYTARHAGVYDLSLSLAGSAAASSPYTVHCAPAAADPLTSTAQLQGGSPHALSPATVHAVARDAFGNRRPANADGFAVATRGAAVVPVVVRPHGELAGVYVAAFVPPLPGAYEVDVWLLQPGGLQARYFLNPWLHGEPHVSRVERGDMAYAWPDGQVVVPQAGAESVSVRWDGFLRAPTSGVTRLRLHARTAARAWVDGELAIDMFDAQDGGVEDAQLTLAATRFHAIAVELRTATGDAFVRLQWQLPGEGSALHTVPAHALWHSPAAVSGSAVSVTVLAAV